MAEDRLTLLCEQTEYTGIDFVAIEDPDDQTVLRVYFIVEPAALDTPPLTMPVDPDPIVLPQDYTTLDKLRIWAPHGGVRIAEPKITAARWIDGGNDRIALEITVAEPGDHSIYRLHIAESWIDGFFNGVEFSFKQGCPSVLDCRRKPEAECDPVDLRPTLDPMARDFASIRQALLDQIAERNPDWTLRSNADVTIMLVELMAALGDELNYVQDRFIREGRLDELSQRRSLRQLVRLLDYEIHDGLTPSTWLEVTVAANGGQGGWVDAGTKVWAHRMGEQPIVFEIGEGLADVHTGDLGNARQFWMHADWNSLTVYEPDGAKPRLAKGATELYLDGHVVGDGIGDLPAGETAPNYWAETQRALVLHETDGEGNELHVHLVHVLEIEELTDVLTSDPITRIRWSDAEALPCPMVIANLEVRANVVPATAGETFTEYFYARGDGSYPDVVEREGPLDATTGTRNPVYRYSPSQCETQSLGWLGELRNSVPEIELQEVDPEGAPASLGVWDPTRRWHWRRTLLDSVRDDAHFTIEDGTWRRIIGFRRTAGDVIHRDWAANAGYTIRFGDGEFGMIPADGTLFRVRYRSGPGSEANVGAGTIVHTYHPLTGTPPNDPFVLAVSNPFDVTSGVDPESLKRVQLLAPEAYKHESPRAVRPEDYIRLAETLDWVQKADATFRWTGSWLTVFVAVDPLGAFELSADQRGELEDLMDCVRQVGRDVFVLEPDYIDLDLDLEICIEPGYYAGQVTENVIDALVGKDGFFHVDKFSFGIPLRRSALEAKVHSVMGVRAVEKIRLRAREVTEWRDFDEAVFSVGPGQILRVQNDPTRPEFGTVVVRVLVPAG
ncbi:MAG: hypothetical protein HC927_02650 [Deltaproteobacteria bacterium]|nr:hypothetical protein [Deltaproteobacteria bacterium]